MTKDNSYNLNSTAASLLGFLHDGDQSGWDLVQTADERIGNFWNITRSQVYRELKLLEIAEYVKRQAVGRRERQPYRLTDKGREAFRTWVNEEPRPEQIRIPLLLHVSFGSHIAPDRLARYLARHLDVHTHQLKQYQTLYAKIADFENTSSIDGRRTLQFGIEYESMVIAWIQQIMDEKQNETYHTKES